MRPIQIYLDSSDFSDFSHLENKPPEYKVVFDYLITMRGKGFIKMFFSEAHVIEAAPTSPAAIPAAMKRFRTIKQLCGKNSLIHPIDVIETEVSQEKIRLQNNTDVKRSDGTWMPALVEVSEFIPNVGQIVLDDVKQLGRAERRKYLKNGKPTARWYAEMREANVGKWEAMASHLPLSTGAVRTVQQYFIGTASRDDALRALHDSIIDLEVFGHWYTKDWSAASSMSQHLREIGDVYKKALRDSRKQFEILMQGHTATGEDPKKFLALSIRAFYDVLAESGNRLAREITNGMGAVSKPIDDPWSATPGLTCSVTLAMHVARRSVASHHPRDPKGSDFPDAYHAIYLPYVDIFRADGFMAGMLGECKLPFATSIVEKILQLPAKIEEILEAQNRDIKL
jgi:hypothetical protein